MLESLKGYFDPYVFRNIEAVISLLLSVGSVAVLGWSFRRFRAPPSLPIALTAVALFFWSTSYFFSIALLAFEQKYLFFNIQLIAGFVLPPVLTASALIFTQQSRRICQLILATQIVIALVMTALAITNAQHELIWMGLQQQSVNGSQMLIPERGPLLTAHLVYSLINLLCVLLLLLHFAGVPYLNNLRSAFPLIIGVIVPLLTYFYALRAGTPVRPISLLALTLFLLVCFTLTWIFLTLRNTSPVIKNQVFNSMTQGVLILDSKLRISDLNRFVEMLIKKPGKRVRDREIYELRETWPQLVQFCLNLPSIVDGSTSELGENINEVIHGEIVYWGDWQHRYYEARSSCLVDRHNRPAGWAVVLTDITEQKRNTRILADEKNRLHLLYTLSHELYGLLTLNEAATKAVDLTVSSLGLYMGELSILENDGETLRVLAVSMQTEKKVAEINHLLKLRVGRGLAGTAAAERTLTIWTELGRNQKWYGDVGIEATVRSGVAIPLLAGDQLLGVLTLLSNEKDGIKESDRPLFTAIALPVALALQNAYRFEEARRRSEFFQELTALSDALRKVHTHDEVVDQILRHSLVYFGAESADIALPTADEKSLSLSHHLGKPRKDEMSPVPISGSLLGHIFSTGQCYYSPDIMQDALTYPKNLPILQKALGNPPIISAIHAPLRAEDNVIGVLILQSGNPHAFQPDALQMLSAFAEIGGSAMWRAQILESLEHRVNERTQELAEANRQLSELDQLKNEFIASVNHELRTPLTNIKLYLSLLADGKEDRRAKYMEVLQRETGHLTRLLDGSLDLTRLENARIARSQHIFTFDLCELITGVADKYSHRIQSKGLELRLQLSDLPVIINGNQEQLEQAISNLLENAINYTDKGFVGIEMTAQNEQALISISDSGYGMPANELPNIWKRFFRGKRVRGMTHAGYGLGLSIVKEVIELHNGQVTVESKENIGSRFDVSLPLAKTKTLNGVNVKQHDSKRVVSRQIV